MRGSFPLLPSARRVGCARGASLVLGLALVLAARGLRADGAPAVHLRLEPEPSLPFSQAELAAAVALRLPLAEGPTAGLEVLVAGAEAGRVRLVAAGRERHAWLGERRGAAAARVVALLVVDLARAERLPSAGPTEISAARTGARTRSWEVGAAAGLDLGAADVGPVLSPAVHLLWALGPRIGVVGRLAYAAARAELRGTRQAVALHAAPARLGLSLRAGRFLAEAGAAARLIVTTGVERSSFVRPGAFVALRAELARVAGVAPFAFAALDAYASDLEVRVAGQPVLAAGYLAPVLGLGISVGGAP